MKLSKKTITVIIIVLAVALAVSSCVYFGIQMARNRRVQALYANYEACSFELEVMVTFLEQKFSDEENQPPFLRVVGGKKLFNPQSGFVNIPDEISQTITVLDQECFVSEDAKLHAITFYGKRIQFNSQNGAYALVYSPEGEPDFLREPTENFRIKVKHIEGDWYHVARVG